MMPDGAERYLKRVSQIQRQHFRNGYLKASHTKQDMKDKSSKGVDAAPPADKSAHVAGFCVSVKTVSADVHTHVTDINHENSRSIQKEAQLLHAHASETRNNDVTRDAFPTVTCDTVGNSNEGSSNEVLLSLRHKPASAASSTPPRRCVSLMDKWFTGNVLKSITLPPSYAPMSDFVVATVRRITAARERIVVLRGAVEDLHSFLLSHHARALAPPDKTSGSTEGETTPETNTKKRRYDVYGCPVDCEQMNCPPSNSSLPDTRTTDCIHPRDLVRRCVDKSNWLSVQQTLMSFAGVEVNSLQAARRVMMAHLRHHQSGGGACHSAHSSNPITALPPHAHMQRWHHWLNTYGPRRGGLPSVSMFVWMSSVGTTALFTVLAQQLLRATRRAGDASHDRVDGKNAMDVIENTRNDSAEWEECTDGPREVAVQHRPRLWIASDEDEEQDSSTCAKSTNAMALRADYARPASSEAVGLVGDCANDVAPRAEENEVCKKGRAACASTNVVMFADPPLSHELSDEQRGVLLFLRHLMPMRGSPAGYGVWLMSCVCCLDTPLDPDTDRVMHELFRTTCEHLRVVGEWRGVEKDRRGALVDALDEGNELEEEKETDMRQYNTMQDIKRADVRALHSIIVILAKFFRQNQNRLIVL